MGPSSGRPLGVRHRARVLLLHRHQQCADRCRAAGAARADHGPHEGRVEGQGGRCVGVFDGVLVGWLYVTCEGARELLILTLLACRRCLRCRCGRLSCRFTARISCVCSPPPLVCSSRPFTPTDCANRGRRPVMVARDARAQRRHHDGVYAVDETVLQVAAGREGACAGGGNDRRWWWWRGAEAWAWAGGEWKCGERGGRGEGVGGGGGGRGECVVGVRLGAGLGGAGEGV